MDAAFAWLGTIMEAIMSLFPRPLKIPTTHGGVKFVCWRPRLDGWKPTWAATVIPLSPGMHVFWPLVTDAYTWPMNRQTFPLPEQTLRTSDGVVVSVRAIVVYKTTNVARLFCEVDEPADTLMDICMESVASLVTSSTMEEIEAADSCDRLKKAVSEAMKVATYGISIKNAFFADRCPSKSLKIWGIDFPEPNEGD